MSSWILIFAFTVPNNPNFNQPIIMDTFTTRLQCEQTLLYVKRNYEEVNIQGKGRCWGEDK